MSRASRSRGGYLTFGKNMEPVTQQAKRRRNLVLWSILIFNFASGAAEPMLYQHKDASTFNSVLGVIVNGYLFLAWCSHDAVIRSFLLTTGMKVRIFLLALWGVPVYFWRSRDPIDFWKNGAGLWLFLPCILGYYGGWYAGYYLGSAFGYFS